MRARDVVARGPLRLAALIVAAAWAALVFGRLPHLGFAHVLLPFAAALLLAPRLTRGRPRAG